VGCVHMNPNICDLGRVEVRALAEHDQVNTGRVIVGVFATSWQQRGNCERNVMCKEVSSGGAPSTVEVPWTGSCLVSRPVGVDKKNREVGCCQKVKR
jgi:hypothetical protein